MRISTITGTYILSLCVCIALVYLLPTIQHAVPSTEPTGIVAGVAIGGAVEPTAENTLYQQLQQEQRLLNQRSKQLDAEQRFLRSQQSNQQLLLYILIIVLFCLILTNFYLDKRRERLFVRSHH